MPCCLQQRYEYTGMDRDEARNRQRGPLARLSRNPGEQSQQSHTTTNQGQHASVRHYILYDARHVITPAECAHRMIQPLWRSFHPWLFCANFSGSWGGYSDSLTDQEGLPRNTSQNRSTFRIPEPYGWRSWNLLPPTLRGEW